MTYLLLCLPFVAVSVAVAALAWRRAPRGHASALALAAGALILLTVVFDTVMIAAGLFGYGDAHLVGIRVGLAPIEDLAYPIAVLLVASAVWNVIAPRAAVASPPGRSAADAHGTTH